MSPRASRLAALLAAATLGACNDTRDLAPPDPASPWHVTASGAANAAPPRTYSLPAERGLPYADPHPQVDPAHVYTLVELVDIAERNNKQTRIAWEQARQAAIGVGLSEAAFLPTLTLDALGGYRRMTTPYQNTANYITSDAEAVFPALVISYLLVDFGAREAATRSARQMSLAANIGFTGVHQQLILSVAKAYFQYAAAAAQVEAANSALSDANLLATDAQSRLRHGEGLVTEIADTRADVAAARFAIASAVTARDDARDALLEVLALPPRTPLRVEGLEARPVPERIAGDVDRMIADALRTRPDLQAALASLRASEADTAQARAELYPKLLLSARAAGDIGNIAIEGGPSRSFLAPETGIYLDFKWTFYEGGAKANRIRLAESREAEQRDRLQQAEDHAMREVAMAYDELASGIARYRAAVEQAKAARLAFTADADAFRHGVGTITAAETRASQRDRAEATLAQAHAQVLASAATLAFATGQLTSVAALPPVAAGP